MQTSGKAGAVEWFNSKNIKDIEGLLNTEVGKGQNPRGSPTCHRIQRGKINNIKCEVYKDGSTMVLLIQGINGIIHNQS